MRILRHINNQPMNALGKALQERCTILVASPESHGISSLGDLETLLEAYKATVASQFARCNPESLRGELHQYQTFEVYNLMYKERTVLSVLSRKTEHQSAFQEYDDAMA
ncbi:hypothetical protein ACEN9X_20315 [Mucilaginibacter sp. Mucisp86]|uniref:hypothetical protein n=1 Tax=Mucilaginibacter sp. Mucisp86 TaxID=3243060 RepID=UPI0039B3AF14